MSHATPCGVKEGKEPTPCSSKLAAPIRGLIGFELDQIESMLFPVLALEALLSCLRIGWRAGGLGLGGLGGGGARGGFAIAVDRRGSCSGRCICGFAHSMFLFCFLAAISCSSPAFLQETCQPDSRRNNYTQTIVR
jgi:hypothetical protein